MKMITPEGTLCDVPQENVSAAEAEGFKLVTDADLARMHNRLFLAQKFFEQKHPTIRNWRLPRGRGQW